MRHSLAGLLLAGRRLKSTGKLFEVRQYALLRAKQILHLRNGQSCLLNGVRLCRRLSNSELSQIGSFPGQPRFL